MIVKVFANLREICGGMTVEVHPEGDRVMDILEKMIKIYPALEDEIFTEQRTLKPFVAVYINGKNIIHGDYLEPKVTQSDQMALFPPVAGG